MKNSQADHEKREGVLYVVSTPLGNLEDITLRALRILKETDLIVAESVEHSRGLCQHFGIRTRLTSYNQHNQKTKTPALITKLKSGLNIALVTNAGTPGVSDPGVYLVSQVLEERLRVVPVPGPSAVTSALSVSGLRGERFYFWGFLSNKPFKRKKELKALVSSPHTMVFFEAPHRLKAMLMDLKDILGDRPVVLVREMTKVFEEVRRGSVSALLSQIEPDRLRGEVTLVVGGKEKGEENILRDEEIQKRIARFLKGHEMTVKDIAQRLSTETGRAYRDVYRTALLVKKRNCSPDTDREKNRLAHGVGKETEN